MRAGRFDSDSWLREGSFMIVLVYSDGENILQKSSTAHSTREEKSKENEPLFSLWRDFGEMISEYIVRLNVSFHRRPMFVNIKIWQCNKALDSKSKNCTNAGALLEVLSSNGKSFAYSNLFSLIFVEVKHQRMTIWDN